MTMNPFSGLRFFRRASDGSMTIASRHWPHLLCWSWALRWRWPDGGRGGEHHKWGLHRFRGNRMGWFVAGPFWLDWQNYQTPRSGR